MNLWRGLSYLVCGDQVDEDGVQQLLRDSVSLQDDGAHQVHHVHLHLLVMAVTVTQAAQTERCFRERGEEV